MPLCNCENGPKCGYHHCGQPAHWSAWVPTWKLSAPLEVPRFFCAQCWEDFKGAWNKPMKGIDRPPHADDEWRPALSDHLNWARIDMANEDRLARERAGVDDDRAVVVHPWEIKARGWTAAQIETVKRMRSMTRKYSVTR
jgi:hypothetical protein